MLLDPGTDSLHTINNTFKNTLDYISTALFNLLLEILLCLLHFFADYASQESRKTSKSRTDQFKSTVCDSIPVNCRKTFPDFFSQLVPVNPFKSSYSKIQQTFQAIGECISNASKVNRLDRAVYKFRQCITGSDPVKILYCSMNKTYNCINPASKRMPYQSPVCCLDKSVQSIRNTFCNIKDRLIDQIPVKTAKSPIDTVSYGISQASPVEILSKGISSSEYRVDSLG